MRRVGLLAFVLLGVVLGAAVAGSGAGALPMDASIAAPTTEPAPNDVIPPTGPKEASRTDRSDVRGGFARPMYTGVAGDPVDVRFTADGDDTYLLIGGNRLTDTGESVGFVDVLRADTGDPINTRTLGTAEHNVESCGDPTVECELELLDEDGEVIAERLDDFPGATGAGGLPRPIAPQRYRLAITNGTFIQQESGRITPVETVDRSELLLEKPALHDEIEVFTTADPDEHEDVDVDGPESLDALESNGLDRHTVTEGDRVVLGFESSGIWGALSRFAEERSAGPVEPGKEIDHRVLSDLLEADEGVSLRIRQTNPGRNERRSAVDLSDADADGVSLLLADADQVQTGDQDPTAGRFYLVLETGPDGPFTETPEPGDEFGVEFALEGTEGEQYRFDDPRTPPAAFEPTAGTDGDVPEQFPYREASDGSVSAEASFSIQERFFRYDHVTDDGELLVDADTGVITGTTSLLPLTELSAEFVNDDGEPIRRQSSLEMDDGEFSVDAGLDDVPPGTRLNYELYEGSSLEDARSVVVVNDTDDPDRLAITDVPGNVTITEGENLSALEVEVRNVGGLEGEDTLTLDVDDGNVTGSMDRTVASRESRHVEFASVTPDLDPGAYSFSLTLGDDERNGTLIVEDDPAKTTITSDDGDGSTDDGEGSAGDGDESTDDGGVADDDDGVVDDGDGAVDDDDGVVDDGDGAVDDDDGADGSGDESTGTNDEGPTDDEQPSDDSSTTVLPFGIGPREAFGGTVLVGATYLLGHWV